jgi:2'-5' RNA ligase
MRYAIELVFDEATETKITGLIVGLQDIGVYPTLFEYDERPHITLALFEADDHKNLLKILKRTSKNARALPLKFENFGIFHEKGVLFLAPAPTQMLLRFHRSLSGKLRSFLKDNRWEAAEYYKLNCLVFHSTLALGLKTPKLLKALQWALEQPFPRSFECVALRLVALRVDSVGISEELGVFPLKPLPKIIKAKRWNRSTTRRIISSP